jgi:hypothetical protein
MNGVDPAYSSGRLQDGIGRIYFMTRIPGMPTIQPVTCAGLDDVQIPIGAMAQDQSGNIWLAQQVGTIVGGSVTINFFSAAIGLIPAPVTLTVYQGPFGWESATPTGAAVIGNQVETAAQYELRRKASVAANALQIMDAIQGQVLAVPGVLDCYAYENDLDTPVVIGGIYIGANSIYVCVLGGTQYAIALAIWLKKGPGCAYTGNTWTSVTAQSPSYNPPIPTYPVGYQTAAPTAFAVVVTLANNSGIPSNALSLVQAAIISAFAGLDGGSRARIGSTVFASRYYGGVLALGTWAQIISIQLGLSGAACTFTGSIAGTTLTVTAIAAGALSNGLLLQDSGLMQPGTVIVTQLTGSTGSTGTYQVTNSQTLASETMNATLLQNDVTVTIGQAPAVSAQNIQLILQTL